MKRIIVLFLVILSLNLFASNIKVDSYVEQTTIGLMDRLKLTIEISGSDASKVSAPELPNIKNFRDLGFTTSSSSSYIFANGKAESSITKKYIYSLKPQNTGKFIIPPIQIKYKKELFTTSPISITVKKGSTKQAPPTSIDVRNRTNNSKNTTANSDRLEDNLFMKTIVSKKTVYQGEPILVDYLFYTRYDIKNLSFGEEASFKGFWKTDVFTPKNINFSSRTENGIRYNVMKMRTIVLYPTEIGKNKIPQQEVLADIRTQSQSFFSFGESKRYNIKSNVVNINVKPLPTSPTNFSGAIGDFSIKAKISSNEMNVGDSFTYTLEISGKGNISKIDVPQLPEINHLRFLDPEISSSINSDGISGKKTIKYLVIAQEQGSIDIPSIPFVYFDSRKGKYLTPKTAPFTLEIGKGNLTYIPSSSAQTAVKMEGADIGFLINITQLKNNTIIFKIWGYWLSIIIMLLTIPASFIYRKEQNKLSSNQNYYRTKRANKILRKYMKEATNFAKRDNQKFYVASQLGLSNFLADKMHIARGSTTEALLQNLSKRNLPNELHLQIKQIFEICNQARFMPGGYSSENIHKHQEMLQKIVTDISKLKF